MSTDKTLVYLLVGVLYAAKTGTAKSQASTTISQTEDEVLIGSSQLHIFFEVLREDFPGVFRREVGNPIEVDVLRVHASLLWVASHLIGL